MNYTALSGIKTRSMLSQESSKDICVFYEWCAEKKKLSVRAKSRWEDKEIPITLMGHKYSWLYLEKPLFDSVLNLTNLLHTPKPYLFKALFLIK